MFIHSVFCLTTGPKPPPKRFLHIVRSRASSFKWEYSFLSLRSSSSILRLLPRLLATSISPFIFPSITCFRRQFLRKMQPIQSAFRFLGRKYVTEKSIDTTENRSRHLPTSSAAKNWSRLYTNLPNAMCLSFAGLLLTEFFANQRGWDGRSLLNVWEVPTTFIGGNVKERDSLENSRLGEKIILHERCDWINLVLDKDRLL